MGQANRALPPLQSASLLSGGKLITSAQINHPFATYVGGIILLLYTVEEGTDSRVPNKLARLPTQSSDPKEIRCLLLPKLFLLSGP